MFFFQAEDGIRDLVRSRGLGDVYKRQDEDRLRSLFAAADPAPSGESPQLLDRIVSGAARPVSYTHLTLPTSDLVEISVVAVSLKKKISVAAETPSDSIRPVRQS